VLRRLAAVVCIALTLALPASAQYRTEAWSGESALVGSPATPYESDIIAARPVRHLLGLLLGGYAFQHQGTFSPNCSCSYGDEAGMRGLIGLDYGLHYPKLGFALHLGVQFHDYGADFSYGETRMTRIAGTVPDTLIDYRKYSHVRVRMLRISPGIEWYPGKSGVFLLAGVDVGYTLAARYDNIERIESGGWYEYPGGGPETAYLAETDIPGADRLHVGAMLGAGIDIRLSDRFILTPRVAVTLPLTPVSSEDPAWKILSEQAALILYYRF
jgi:hypothetical protein